MEDLTPKTKLQSCCEHDYDGFLAVLKKNRKKLAIDPARREPAETLRAEFEGSFRKLMQLRERIERTDGLIDGCAAVRADGRGDRDGGRKMKRNYHFVQVSRVFCGPIPAQSFNAKAILSIVFGWGLNLSVDL